MKKVVKKGRAPSLVVPEKEYPRFPVLYVGFGLLVVALAVYWDFLFSGLILLYKDIGSDSINSYYPDFVQLSRYIRNEGFPSWSFHVGMGQDLAYATGFLVWQPVSWLPQQLIAHALVLQHLGKIALTGLFFFRFLQLHSLPSPVAFLGALLLSLSAYMCMGSCWYPLADEVVCFSAILLGVESAIRRGRWLLLVGAVALVGMITPFHLYLAALLLVIYVPTRLYCEYPSRTAGVLRNCLMLAGLSTVGVGLGAIVTVPYLYAVLNSPRGSGTTSFVTTLVSSGIFSFEPALHNVTAALRPFSNDMLGAGDNFRGWQNYLEAPITYCGLLSLLIFPQAFLKASKRQKIILLLFVGGVLIPTVLPWFRYLFWLFQGDYYRTHSLFSIIGMIVTSMMVLSGYMEGKQLNLWLLAGTECLLLGILYFPFVSAQNIIVHSLQHIATIFLLLIGVVLVAGQFMKRQRPAIFVIVALSIVELVIFDRVTVLDRKTVTNQELKTRVGYNDETADVVRDIMQDHEDKFFRLTKLRPSGLSDSTSLNDAMVFGYFGTSSYSSFNSVNYTNFLTAVDAIPPNSETNTRWTVGLADSAVLSAFACEKYLLVDDLNRFPESFQYKRIKDYGKDFLFQNQMFLPFGLIYDGYIPETLFASFPNWKKQEALLRVTVLPDEKSGHENGLSLIPQLELEKDIRETAVLDVVRKRRETAFNLTSFRQSHFEGTARLDKKGILLFQTPFDQGWRAFRNGLPTPVIKADVGLLGVPLDLGEHKLELRYRNPFLLLAIGTSAVSAALLFALWWRYPRLRLRS